MNFYQSIHQYYDHIFPLNKQQVVFTKEELQAPGEILDIGCGTGNLAIALANEGFDVDAIDLDESMIETADKKSNGNNPRFSAIDMLEIASVFNADNFDAITCFGNTLVHLTDNARVQHFFNSVYTLLKPGGKFLFQVLNYETILRNKPDNLPLIDNDIVRFDRKYEYSESGFINFKTSLTVKTSEATLNNEVQLNPLTKMQLEEMLQISHFKNIEFFGNFNHGVLSDDSLPLVCIAECN
ncbi:MAG: class I SAM-dependent methyltransferase [Prolixibacteraceae bacterium]|jgi:glycine/sarcosine N-methyltransferase|nr:class I SAM-dependent methyltransferase [Prolixibacteraceae bacterium]